MGFLQTNRNELEYNFGQLLSYMEEPILLINPSYQATFVNPAFEKMVQQPKKSMLNKHYGNALGCRYLVKDNRDCGSTYACNICGFRNSIDHVFNTQEVSENNLVRDFEVNGEVLFKHVYYKTIPMKLEGILFVALIITQVNQADS